MNLRPGRASRYNYYLFKFKFPQLNEGNRGKTDCLDEKKMTIAEWIEKVDKNEQRANFLFPSKMGGPDLMFFLSNGENKILCAAQVYDLESQSGNRC